MSDSENTTEAKSNSAVLLPSDGASSSLSDGSHCSICFENGRPHCTFSRCQHSCCKACCLHWIEKEESSGQPTATCPFCRASLLEVDLISILGRKFQPNTRKTAFGFDENGMDDLTRQLLLEETRPCPSCGARIMKQDGCDKMECLCGFRFCYACGAHRAECSCTPAHHFFWDNILDQQAPRQPPRIAQVDEETGVIDLAAYLRVEEPRRQFRLKYHYLQETLALRIREKLLVIRNNPGLDDAYTLKMLGIRVARRRKFLQIRVRQGQWVLVNHLRERENAIKKHPGADGTELLRIATSAAKQRQRQIKRRRFRYKFRRQCVELDQLLAQRRHNLQLVETMVGPGKSRATMMLLETHLRQKLETVNGPRQI